MNFDLSAKPARAAKETAISYANRHEQLGRQFGQFQMIQDPISQDALG